MREPDSGGAPENPHTYLCFDFGERRIGVAVGQALTGTASPLEVLVCRSGIHWRRIEQLIDQWQPHALVLGVPLTEEGRSQPMTARAQRFARQLEGRFGLPVHRTDERYSSREAKERFRARRAAGSARQSGAGREDAVAAQIILENWFADAA